MPDPNEHLQAALDRCNSEPIHIPGLIQDCGAIVGLNKDDLTVAYASENIEAVFGKPQDEIFGQRISKLTSHECAHDIRNVLARGWGKQVRSIVGLFEFDGGAYHLSCSPSGDYVVLEFEPQDLHGLMHNGHFASFPAMMNSVFLATSVQDLMERLVRLTSMLSGYDRVMVYRFDADWNGQVIAEAKQPHQEAFLGLRFPHWDIPEQARAFMSKFPVRYIADVNAPQVPIVSADPDAPPLDISLAQLRGTSPIHLQYLRNMNVAGTLTLSIVVDERLWGIVSFHHEEPMIPTAELRQICASVAPIINLKMQSLQQAETLDLHDTIDRLRFTINSTGTASSALLQDAQAAIDAVQDRFDVDGVQIGLDDEHTNVGTEIPIELVNALRARAQKNDDGIWHTQSLIIDFPDFADDLEQVSGAMCLDRSDGRWIVLTRKPRTSDVAWAGAPNKDIDTSDGMARLDPRGSFTLYKETVKDTSHPWQKQDIKLLENLSLSLMVANQRKVLLAAMKRQQDLVVDELNHRVRNILSLVRSISRQAKQHETSIDAYTDALESRLSALATAHDLGAGSTSTPVSIHEIIRVEAAPHLVENVQRLALTGEDVGIARDQAPIFALVMHELMTNAAKYGALSVPTGLVMVSTRIVDEQLSINWVEIGGPTVIEPERNGFGTTLIEQAIPYELSGSSEVIFNPTGVTASITLPKSLIEPVKPSATIKKKAANTARTPKVPTVTLPSGTILIVEDNYMIAIDLMNNLRELGFEDCELAANHEQALRVLDHFDVAMAILDINLGRGGTSIETARTLKQRNVPFFFVTGYGELAPLPSGLEKQQKLQKPVSLSDLEGMIHNILVEEKAS